MITWKRSPQRVITLRDGSQKHGQDSLRPYSFGTDSQRLDAWNRSFGSRSRLWRTSGSPVCFYPTTEALGLVMPSNSPAVNSLWLPSIALKIPIVMKPGREEPWTPFRLIQSFIKAGCPKEAFGFYPTDHEGAGDILRMCGRALIFGDKSTTDLYAGDPCKFTDRASVRF